MNTNPLFSPELPFYVIGHRGVIGHPGFYQNSYPAYQEALKHGDGIEVDAITTRDRVVFLAHESSYNDPRRGAEYTLKDHFNGVSAELMGTRRIDEVSAPEMRQMRLRNDEKIPELSSVIDLVNQHPGKILLIELKGHDVVEPVLRDVKQAIYEGRIDERGLLISSFDHFALAKVRENLPQIPVAPIFIGEQHPEARLYPWVAASPATYTPLTAKVLESSLIQKLQPEFVGVLPTDLSAATLDKLDNTGLKNAKLASWVPEGMDDSVLLPAIYGIAARGRLAAMLVNDTGLFKQQYKTAFLG